jgi:hypothetical protein
MRIVTGVFSGIFSLILVIALVALGIVITLNLTMLSPDFAISELDKLDAYSIITDKVREQIPTEEPYMAQVVDATITELEPWLREQTNIAVYGIYAYLKGDQELDIVIPLEQVRTCIKENAEQAILESLPPGLAGASQSQIQAFLSQVYAEIDNQIPQQIELNEASLGPDVTAQFQKARQIVGYIQLGYKLLIGLAVLLILLIALVQWWHIKPIALYVGIPMAVAGAVSLVGSIVSGSLISGLLHDIPAEIMSILPQLITDATRPLRIYGIALLIAGIGLIVLSIRLKPSNYAS